MPKPGRFDDLDVSEDTRLQLSRLADAFLAILDVAAVARDRRPQWAGDVIKLLDKWASDLEDLEEGRVPGEGPDEDSEKWNEEPTRREKRQP